MNCILIIIAIVNPANLAAHYTVPGGELLSGRVYTDSK